MKIQLVVTDDANTVAAIDVERCLLDVDKLVEELSFYCERCRKTYLLLYMSSEPTMCNNCFVDHLTNPPEREDR